MPSSQESGPVGFKLKFADGLAFAVLGVGGDAPAYTKAVALCRFRDEADGLGRLAKGDGQDAGGQGIQRPGVAGRRQQLGGGTQGPLV